MLTDYSRRLNLYHTLRRKYPAVLIWIILAGGASTAVMACGWFLYTDRSVRFNSERKGRGFYRLPPLPIMYDPKTGKELSVAESYESYYDEGGETADADGTKKSEEDDLWDRSKAAVDEGELLQARTLLEKYLSVTGYLTDYGDTQQKRNAARDLLDAMSALRSGSSHVAVKEYLKARYAYLNDPTLKPDNITSAANDPNLRDNWDYLRAAALVDDSAAALSAFRSHAAKYPRSEKNEAVLYMIAKLTMQSSVSFENTKCGIEGKDEWGKPIDPASRESDDVCRDDNWKIALAAFKQLTNRYPNRRYRNDARGWIAYLYRRGGMRAEALAQYYRLLGDRWDLRARLDAKKSLQILGQDYDDATLDKVEQLIAGEPDAALAYAYHRIYNQAVDGTYTELSPYEVNDYSEYGIKERNRVSEANADGKHELERVAKFASAMMRRYPNAKVGGAFVLRLAEAQIELQDYRQALESAKRAIELGVTGEARSQALWIKGSAEHQQKDLKAAETTFKRLIAEFPDSKLTEGARRLLALVAEARGDLETALKIYIDLKYDYDVAYYVDVLLPTERLAGFIADNPSVPSRNYLMYSLGVRYLRDRRWEDARAVLARVETQPGIMSDPSDYYSSAEKAPTFPKEPNYGANKDHRIDSEWVAQDIKTADALERLERGVQNAQGDEARAEAMYQYASYQYGASTLLFYNPAAWEGLRYSLLSDLADSERFRLPNEWQNLFEYSQSHDTAARVIPLYLGIVDEYPNTKAARDALYTAAVAQERIANFNNYWRSVYERGLFAGPRNVGYDDVKRAYPNYQLPRGTDGWEPATRTVNGGPGWAPKPKPPVRLTRTQKVTRKLQELAGTLGERVMSNTTYIAGVVPPILREVIYAFAFALLIWSAVWIRIWQRQRSPKYRLPSSAMDERTGKGLSEDGKSESFLSNTGND
jgi:outer membrane protein assembly factor BamD (BamD/ComL family)